MPRQRDQSKKILDWEDLERAPNTRGAFSFLKSAAEIVNIRRDSVNPGEIVEKPPEGDSTTVASTTTVVEKRSRAQPARVAGPRLCRLAQDGHSLGESALYQMLWSRGEPETDETRIISAGWRTMRRFCGMTDKNCKRNASSLIEKLAIEVIEAEDIHTRKGRTYRVHSYATILIRRRAAGMEWVARDKSRRFVRQDGRPLRSESEASTRHISDSTTVAAKTTVADLVGRNSTTVVGTALGTVVNTTPGTGVATTPLLGSSLGIQEEDKPSTTTEVDLIVSTLAAIVGLADAKAALSLLSACRAVCPDATTEEIIGVIREKAFAARARRDVRNLTGFLLTTVPLVFEGAGISSYRRMVLAEAEAARLAEADRKCRESEMDDYFSKQREQLRSQLSDAKLTEKKRAEIARRIGELDSLLKRAEGNA